MSEIGQNVSPPLCASKVMWIAKPSEQLHKAREFALSTWARCFRDFIYIMRNRHYPDDLERARFTERVISDLSNPDYKLYTDMYVSV